MDKRTGWIANNRYRLPCDRVCRGLILFIIGLIDLQDMDDEERKRFKTSFRISVPVFLFGLLGTIFIPGKETLLEILIAKTATVENAEWTVDAVKQAVDYIVNAIQTLK